MHTVVLASRKGGAGKTTLASHLAVEAEAAGDGAVAITDTDRQGGLVGWWNARVPTTPECVTPARGLASLPEAIAAARQDYRLLLIDTPPSLSEAISEVVAVADL